MTMIFEILIGVFLLLFGRKLFWLLVGGIGFFAGSALASLLFHGASEWVILGIALAVGIIGAVLAQLVQKVGVALAGFIVGGMVFSGLVTSVMGGFNIPQWVVFIIGGVFGILLTVVLFEWSLIILSSVAGAWMITDAMQVGFPLSALVIIVLFFIGLTLQFRLKRKEG